MRHAAKASGPVLRLLIADDDPSLARRLAPAFARMSADVRCLTAATLIEAEGALRAQDIDCVLANFALDAEGLRMIERFRAITSAPLVIMSQSGSVSMAVEAMRRGAEDFLVRPIAPEMLARRLLARLDADGAARRPSPLPSPCHGAGAADFEGFVGQSEVMHSVYAQVERVASSRAPVFITGESGTGKDVAAEAIHARSRRMDAPFIAINCAAIPRDLMEAEIFGHARGAFTGATEDRAGAAELAHGGTLFLDELCEMDVGLQAKLLRLIQTGELRRVGDARPRSVDVRFICATNRDPQAEIAAGRFRQDLFYRLHVLPIALPPLRQRSGDVIRLARALLARFSAEEGRAFEALAPEAELRLALYPWPGNVRELQNVLRRIVVLNDARFVTAEMLPPEVNASRPVPVHVPAMDGAQGVRRRGQAIEPLWMQEQRIIEDAVAACGGNTARAAAALGISPSTIYRKRQAWASGMTAAE